MWFTWLYFSLDSNHDQTWDLLTIETLVPISLLNMEKALSVGESVNKRTYDSENKEMDHIIYC